LKVIEMFKNRLSLKLLVAFLALTLAVLALSGVAINWALSRQFESYIEESKEEENLRILDVVTAYYADRGTWRGISPTLAHIGLSTETLIILTDHQGGLVYNSLMDMRGMMGTMRRVGLNQRVRMEQEGESFTYDVKVEGTQVGTLTLTLLGREGILAQEDLDFSRTINYSITLIAFLAGLGALATSLFLSRRLTRPLASITTAVSQLKEGDLSQRVEVGSQDELGILAQAFNSMADKLENTEKNRRKLAADISHELRTPLTTLKSYLEAFKDGVLPPSEENITSLQEEVERLESLVKNLQELSLVESRTADLPLTLLNPAAVLQKVHSLYQPLLLQKGIRSSLLLPEKNIAAMLNEDALERILHNLLSNAVKYTPKAGEITLCLWEGTEDGGKKTVLMEISDTGSGIDSKELPHIFERFYRADPSRSRSTGGFGIGLTIVRELVEAQGGRVRAQSRPGKGTVFTLTFPAMN
jgi:two-component system, OmpR family, sensor histidine kinase BaeS